MSGTDHEKFNRILKGLNELRPDSFMDAVRRVIWEHPNTAGPFADALSIGQIKSKKWLLEELKLCSGSKLDEIDLGSVYILAGWYGTLAYLLKQDPHIHIKSIVNVDLDPICEAISQRLNLDWIENWRYKAITMDIQHIDYSKPFEFPAWSKNKDQVVSHKSDCNTIICTSCEHITEWDKLYRKFPEGKLLILQSNNFDIPEHTNRSESLEQFEAQTPMERVLFSGELDCEIYTRFMRIGIR